ncbi:MAG: hypothetical protein ACYDA8_16945 [Deferrisomatales bacterium]
MSERPATAPAAEPSAEELHEILADLDFFLNLDEAEALPLDEAVAQAGQEDDDDE